MNNHSPLTPSQLQIWKSQTISPNSPLFNQVVTLKLDVPTDAPKHVEQRMRSAWQAVVSVHPALQAVVEFDHQSGVASQHHGGVTPDLITLDFHESTIEQWVAQRSVHQHVLSESLVDAVLLTLNQLPKYLYLNIHHLVADAWSTQLICDAVISEFHSPGSAKVEIASFESHIGMFKNADTTEPNNTASPQNTAHRPTFYGLPAKAPTTESQRHQLPLTTVELDQLNNLYKHKQWQQLNHNMFLFSVHLTALVSYLHRVSFDTVIEVDVPLTGRFDNQWLNTVGNFVEVARLSINIQPTNSSLDIYRQCRDKLYALLKDACSTRTEKNKPTPVHGVLNIITAQRTLSDTQLQWHHTGHSDTHHPLRLHITDWNNTGQSTVELDLNDAFFESTRSDLVLDHLCCVYRGLLNNHESPVGSLPMVQPSETWQFHGAHSPNPVFSSLPSALLSRLSESSNAIAVSNGDTQLTNEQLIDHSTIVRNNLHVAGVGKGDRVVVHVPRTLMLPAILLGIMRAGAAYIPIDVEQPDLRANDIVDDSQASCIISQTPTTFDQCAALSIEDVLKPLSSDPTVQQPFPDASDTAYIMYTSGSTGKPKGVVVSHGALMSYLGWARSYYDLGEPIVMPMFSSIGFDLTVTSLYLPILSDGFIRVFEQHSPTAQANTAGTVILDVLRDTNINTLKLTPAHLTLLTEKMPDDTALKQLIVGGEDLKSDVAVQIAQRFSGDISIVNEYGPTEATVGCIAHRWQSNAEPSGSVPIGLPVTGMSAYVLDDYLQPQIEGLPGMLYVSGSALADGYWNSKKLSEQAFIDNPWQPGTRLYNTGDLVRVQDNRLVYLGRKDGMVKINGYRIELGEIERILQAHPDISQCVAVAAVSASSSNEPDIVDENKLSYCRECGLDSRHPDANLDGSNLCGLCRQFEPNQQKVAAYFKSTSDLKALLNEIKSNQASHVQAQTESSKYDALVLLSGGKDSTYSLCRLVDMGLNVYAFSLDNGYLSPQAKTNIDNVCATLGVKHHYATSPEMDNIFVDSLARYSNVCHGCFKTIYTLSLDFAARLNIRTIFTGLSRGQLFETRLSNELFAETDIAVTTIDDMVQAARLQYHATDDGPNRLLNIRKVNDGTLVNQIAIVDFYRYCHVEMSDMLTYIKERAGWVRPPDTGRSTNCLINEVGIHVHKLERGFHNYSLPYSWDVRLGHKKRAEVIEELDDDINQENVDQILSKIGYTPKTNQKNRISITACYTATSAVTADQLQDWVGERLPSYMHPHRYSQLQTLPINSHGKIDRKALLKTPIVKRDRETSKPLSTRLEIQIANVWKSYLSEQDIFATDNFFSLGGDSLSAIRCVLQIRKMGFAVTPADLFHQPRLCDFAVLVEMNNTQNDGLAAQTSQASQISRTEKFASLHASQREKLQRLLSARKT